MNSATQQAFDQGNLRANAAYQSARRNVTINPITRLEGHGKIDIFLDDKGDVERAYLQVPELRGFEVFSLGRPAEDMPQITSRICGVCPTAHHMASTKALDALYKVEPTPAGRKIRELVYNTFMLEDHALHVFVLGELLEFRQVLGLEGFTDSAGQAQHGMDDFAAEVSNQFAQPPAAADDFLAGLNADLPDDADDVALLGRGFGADDEVGAAQHEEVERMVFQHEGVIDQFANLAARRGGLDFVKVVQRLG